MRACVRCSLTRARERGAGSASGGVRVSLVHYELYNDTVRDLVDAAARATPALLHGGSLRTMRDDALGAPLTAAPVGRLEDALALVGASCALRATASTACNDASSRSHSVLRIGIERGRFGGGGGGAGPRGSAGGALYMVDLAGSERMQESGASGARAAVRGCVLGIAVCVRGGGIRGRVRLVLRAAKQETCFVNKSLSALGDVIAALVRRDPHVPYRNSKVRRGEGESRVCTGPDPPDAQLTKALQHCLGAGSKTLLVVNASDVPAHREHTLRSLRFGAKAASCAAAAPRAPAAAGGDAR